MATAVHRPRPFDEKPEPTILAKPARRATYVWELPVRLTHWTIVIGIVVLSLTGYYIHHPILSTAATHGASNPGFLLATMRFSHDVTAFVFIAAFLARIY